MPVAVLTQKVRRIARFFGIKDTDVPMWLGQVILPVLDVAPYTRVTRCITVVLDVHLAAATIATVPAGERWILRNVNKTITAGNPGVRLFAPDGTNPAVMTSTLIVLGGLPESVDSHFDLAMDAANYLQLQQGAVGDVAITVNILYDKEDA